MLLVRVVPGRTAACCARNSSASAGSHLRFTNPGSPSSETSANIFPPTLKTATSSPKGYSSTAPGSPVHSSSTSSRVMTTILPLRAWARRTRRAAQQGCRVDAGAMVPDAESIGDWLHHGTSDAREVADRYDKWAQSYDDDLASWSYQAPTVVAETVVTRQPAAGSVLDVGCGTDSSAERFAHEDSQDRSSGSTSRKRPSRSPSIAERMTRSSAQTSSSDSPSRRTASMPSSVWG